MKDNVVIRRQLLGCEKEKVRTRRLLSTAAAFLLVLLPLYKSGGAGMMFGGTSTD